VGCSVVQYVAVGYSMLQCVAVCCSRQDAFDVYDGEGIPVHRSGRIVLQHVADYLAVSCNLVFLIPCTYIAHSIKCISGLLKVYLASFQTVFSFFQNIFIVLRKGFLIVDTGGAVCVCVCVCV